MKTFLVDQVGIITRENIDKKLQLYADILIVLMDIKKKMDIDCDDSSESDDDISIGSDGDSIRACDIKLVEVDTDSDEE